MSDPVVQTQPDCTADTGPAALSVDDARARILRTAAPVTGHERLAIRSALGRTLAEDVASTIDVPAHDNSAMDGYAMAGSELPVSGARELRVIGTALAGRPFARKPGRGECVRIMTGAAMPAGTDTVIMQERVARAGDVARIGAGHRPGQNVRLAGEDLARGRVALAAGRLIKPADLGLLASMGVSEVRVARRLRVAFFSTGDELRSLGEPLARGQVYDSNRYTLYGMLSRLGVELIDMGVVADTRDAIRNAFREADAMADAVITTGGVSVGEADFVKETLAEIGHVDFWKIALKPGRPLAFGRLGESLFFGLPGNPVAVMVTFYQFVQPALQRMMGQAATPRLRLRVPCATRIGKRPGRTEFVRGVLRHDNAGQVEVDTFGAQGSGILSSMSQANCFIVLAADQADIAPGDMVDVEPFDGIV